jgi:FkbM family methyltransferase
MGLTEMATGISKLRNLIGRFLGKRAYSKMEMPTRMQTMISARETLGNDFFGGWAPADVDLFNKYHRKIDGSPGYISDYFGVRTRTDYVPWASRLDGLSLGEPPIPDDAVRAEAIEYFALLDTLDATSGASFTMVELGASYAPWGCMAGAIAKRLGKRATIRAVEASAYFHSLIAENFAANGLSGKSPDPSMDVAAIHGAVGIRKGSIFFPVVTSAFENGGQAAAAAPDKDYTGRAVAHEEVPVRTLDEIFQGLDVIDFLHCDIQGSEGEVLIHGASQISQKVRRMFIGTHSRKIEGDLIECYHRNGWRLVRERPVTFDYRADLASVVGMTTRDGGQYWINTRL